MTSMARLVSLAILTTLIIFLGITFFQIVVSFLLPLFLAAMTAVWCQPLYGYFFKRFRQRDRWAAAATTGSVCLILFVPLVIGVFSAAMQIRSLTRTGKSFVVSVMENLQQKELTEGDFKDQVRQYAGKALDYVKPPPGATATEDERTKAEAERQQTLEDWEEKILDASQDAGSYLQDLAKKSLGLAASGGMGLASETFDLLGAAVGGLIQLTMF